MAAKLTRLTHRIVIQLNLSLQAASPETFGYTLVFLMKTVDLSEFGTLSPVEFIYLQ
jgi:hypothetical protein